MQQRLLLALIAFLAGPAAARQAAPLPAGVRAVWDLKAACRESTPTRERVCLNGLWRWQPAEGEAAATARPPAGGWGWFKVPGCWPGITDYQQKDCQTVFRNAAWSASAADLAKVTTAWYERDFTAPSDWRGRRIAVSADYVNSDAAVYLDGKLAGDIRFPAGQVDLTPLCRPGVTHHLAIRVAALPLKAVMLAYTDTNSARAVPGAVPRRGLCGDVWLTGEPAGARIAGVRVDTFVRRGEIAFATELRALDPRQAYRLRATVLDATKPVRQFASAPFTAADVHDGRFGFTAKWRPAKLWDIDTPGNVYTARLELEEVFHWAGWAPQLRDTALPVRFGFREFWISGRDFYLNGSRIWLSAVPLDNAGVGAAWSTYAGARESLERLKGFGINFVYTHNYDCEPGSHLSFAEILHAADDVGMLVALTQPHFSAYDWASPDAERTNGYAHHAAFYVGVAGSHPSVVAYATSHNATSYDEAKNPDRIDGIQDPRTDSWSHNNAGKALRAEAIVKRLDLSRIVYHHSSGNLGSMYTENFYVNFAPRQELDDWFEHWATQGVKPLFLCEYGVPFSWDWTMYRGWYKGRREWGSAVVPWEYCLAEWNAQFMGDRAYRLGEREKADIRWEAREFRISEGWHRWDYPNQVGSSAVCADDGPDEVFAEYIQDNWRSYRTWGVSAFSPWEYEAWWLPRPGVDRNRKELPVDWDHLQRPGYSPDYIDSQYESMDMAFERSDWIPSVAAHAVLRNNRPLLAYIGGKAPAFTEKGHNFLPGETVEKQLILINNSRRTVTADCAWTLALPQPVSGSARVQVETGQQARIPLRLPLATGLLPGQYTLSATVRFTWPAAAQEQRDTFDIDVLAAARPVRTAVSIALFDPRGETRKLLDDIGVRYTAVDGSTDLSSYDVLVVGKRALTLTGAAPDVRRVREGLKVVVFEQTAQVLEQRLGFRTEEYGLRRLFPRVPDHPLLAGVTADELHDWRGSATILPPRLQYTLKPMYGPMVEWCGIELPHVWRCGCRGNLASVLIEKPARGDFLPIVDGGYAQQYAPLIQYREGRGLVLFCQMDVTGRNEADPAARTLARNILQYACDWQADARRIVVYAGEAAGRAHLETGGLTLNALAAVKPAEGLLIAGPRCETELSPDSVAAWIRLGGRVLAVGLDDGEARGLFGDRVRIKPAEHIGCSFAAGAAGSWRAGVAPADVQDRDPRSLPLVAGGQGADVVGDGVLATSSDGAVRFCQLVPWQFELKPMNQKRTFRRATFLLSRLAADAGAGASSPLLDDFARPVGPAGGLMEHRWLDGLYLDRPEEWDDPYRFFGW